MQVVWYMVGVGRCRHYAIRFEQLWKLTTWGYPWTPHVTRRSVLL